MDLLLAIRRIALAEVVADEPSVEYRLRRIYRWYSAKFNTPLHEVERLPLEYVLLHFFESFYEDKLDAGRVNDLEDERVELTETPEERVARLAREEDDDRLGDEFARLVEEEEQAKAAQRTKETRALPRSTRSSEASLPSAERPAKALPVAKKTASLAEVTAEQMKLPPDIKMQFEVEPEDLGLDDMPDELPEK